jgi:hypothetical protein
MRVVRVITSSATNSVVGVVQGATDVVADDDAISTIGTDRPVCVIGTIRLAVPIIPIRVRFPHTLVVRVVLILLVARLSSLQSSHPA